MEKVTFKPNVPQQVALKYAQGRMISGRWGEQVLYTLTDERQMYVPTEVAAQINLLGVNVHEPFCICKRWDGQRGQLPRWDVWLTPRAEQARASAEMSDETALPETELERQLRESLAHVQKSGRLVVSKLESTNHPETASPSEPASLGSPNSASPNATEPSALDPESPAANGTVPQESTEELNGHSASPGWVQILRAQTEALTDLYAASIKYASDHHGNAIKPEDIRALMTTAFINLAQRGRSRG